LPKFVNIWALKKIIDAKVAGWQHELREVLRAGSFADVLNVDAIKDETELPKIARQFGAHFELEKAQRVGMIRFKR
jgi:hypothetical protein